MKPQIFIVCLRQPSSSLDHREDPYWEVGSFGCTGCKKRSLLNPKKEHISKGSWLAFAQGGPEGTKLVLLTKLDQVDKRTINGESRREARWSQRMPFRYADAPLLINEDGKTCFPELKKFIKESKSEKWTHKFSSRFRSCASPLRENVAEEVKSIFEKLSTPDTKSAESYLDAIPELGSWKEEIKKTKCWEKKDRVKGYNEMCAHGVRKPPRCGKKKC